MFGYGEIPAYWTQKPAMLSCLLGAQVITILPTRHLEPRAFVPVQLSEVAPQGWLLSQLRLQANGLNGMLDQFWPQVSESVWIGGNYQQSAGGERATYWLNGHVPLHHLLANVDNTSSEAIRTGASVSKYVDYIVTHQDASGWLGLGANDTSGQLYWARYYLLFALALRAEASPLLEKEKLVQVMLRHVHASATKMEAEGWYDKKGGGWGTYRVHGK